MTRKHYIALAAALRAARPDDQLHGIADAQHRADVLAVAAALAKSFPNFDAARFVAAARGE